MYKNHPSLPFILFLSLFHSHPTCIILSLFHSHPTSNSLFLSLSLSPEFQHSLSFYLSSRLIVSHPPARSRNRFSYTIGDVLLERYTSRKRVVRGVGWGCFFDLCHVHRIGGDDLFNFSEKLLKVVQWGSCEMKKIHIFWKIYLSREKEWLEMWDVTVFLISVT